MFDCYKGIKRADKTSWLLVGCFTVLTLFRSFNAESGHFDKLQTILFCISIVFFCLHTAKYQDSSIYYSVYYKYTV